MRNTNINNQGVTIHYQVENPKGNNTIIMGHGTGNCIEDWYELGYIQPLVQANFRVIMPEVRGHGGSDKPTDPALYAPSMVASDHLAVLDALHIDRCHYFGSSKGASLGFYLAKHHRQRFLSFSLCDAEPYADDDPYNFALLFGKVPHEISGENLISAFEAEFSRPFPGQVGKRYSQNHFAALSAFCRVAWPDHSDAFDASPMPCQLIVAGKQAANPFYQSMCQYQKDRPYIPLHVLPGLSHAEAYWAGAIVIPMVISFILGC